MLEIYTELKEKVDWLNSFLIQSHSAHKKNEESLLQSIRIPRKAQWNASLITQLVEKAEKQRKETEELIALYEITILRDIEALLEKINSKINTFEQKMKTFDENLKNLRISIDKKRNMYSESLNTNKIDTWFCAVEYKNSIELYAQERELTEQNYLLRIGTKDKDYEIYLSDYKNIFYNYSKIESVFADKMSNLYCKGFEENNESVWNDDETKNKLQETAISKNEDAKNRFMEECYVNNENMAEINNAANNSVIKYGIYKCRISSQSSWNAQFVVYTRGHFLHMFDLSSIIANDKNIKVKFSNIIKRIYEKPTKKLMFFKDKSVSSLNMSEEVEFLELCSTIYNELIFLCKKDIRCSILISNKVVKFNKELYEINIESKNLGSISNLFAPNITRIKSFLLKDIYELYFGFNDKMVSCFDSIDKKASVAIEEKAVEKTTEGYNKTNWTSIKTKNPWLDE